MTPRNRILIMIALLVLPVLVRVLFFYQFPYWNFNVATPEYTKHTVPQPPTPSSKGKAEVGTSQGKVVVVDNAHGNLFVPDEVEPLVTALSVRGARVEFDDGKNLLEEQLRYASAYVIFSPGATYTGEETLQIQQFVANGGRLLVFADPTRRSVGYNADGNPVDILDVNTANPLLAPFGLAFSNDYLYNLKKNEGNFRNVEFTDFVENPLTKDLGMVVFYGAHGVNTQTGSKLVNGGPDTLSSLTDRGGGLSPIALSPDKQVLAVGDFTFLTDPYNQVADNALLLGHIADFALGGQRTPSLSNFPFVFEHPVSLVARGDAQLTTDLLGPIAALQKTLQAVNINLTVNAKPASEGDVIVLGTLSPSDDLDPYLKPFGIELTDGSTLDLTTMGKVSKSGIGLLLFNHGPKTNTLTVLADTTDNLPKLIELVANGDFSACVIQGDMAVCSIGDSSSSGGFDSGFGDSGFFDTPTPEGTSGATATPEVPVGRK